MPFLETGCNIRCTFFTCDDYMERFLGSSLWTWGNNNQGQLGKNDINLICAPSQTISSMSSDWTSVTTSVNTVAGIKSNGSLWVIGRNQFGQVGNNSTASVSSPVQTVAGGCDWRQVSSGGNMVAAIKTNGTLWTWGRPAGGALGVPALGTTVSRSSPGQTISGGTDWRCLSTGYSAILAIKTNGTLWGWGDNSSGVLGICNTVLHSSPVQISTDTTWCRVSFTSGAALAIKNNGTLWSWGAGTNGQLGNNTAANLSSPVQVGTGTDWRDVSCGNGNGNVAGAIKRNGSLWMWGYNNFGGLADGTAISKSSPVQTIAGGNNWKSVTIGCAHVMAVKTDGTLWTWATLSNGNVNGQMGLGTATGGNLSSPIQVISGGIRWVQVQAALNGSQTAGLGF